MKVNKASLAHWMLLLGLFQQGLLGLIRRTLQRNVPKQAIVFYGHKLNGNLLALYRYLEENEVSGLRPVFLTMDADYHRELQAIGVDSRWAASLDCSRLLAEAAAVITSHGLHSLQPLRKLYRAFGVRFFDVWHGIPFKGFDANDFRVQHKYDETWVASELNRDLYIRKFGFAAERVVVTGYARTDRLVRDDHDMAKHRASLGLPVASKLILFAPTWKQDAVGRSLYPFGCSEKEFLGALVEVAGRNGAGVVLRSHLNSGELVGQGHPILHTLSANRYPDAEAILLACDMLVCDWSSIAFDYMLLDRPTFFLDVEPPFAKGFSLGSTYRYGPVIKSLQALTSSLEQALQEPEAYWQARAVRHYMLKREVYGGLADGLAAKRCIERLCVHIGP